ncbi:ACP S-malonyltransferase [Streptomyces sp. yr375]|uniref:ACP S-malonyltransferase n=1 Tax=Streptomyces sp. yr375 TaxID=1761906 RepID=UPI001C435C7D|nr:ACP S-malonyltransferase [Streptomyces sp. yr375]
MDKMNESSETTGRRGTAIVFPGMGPASFAESGRFMVGNAVARRMVAVADRALGYSLVDRLGESTDDYSEAAQVAFMVNCLALAEWAGETIGCAPDVCAGPSFGAKAATAYTGSLPVADAVRMTARMARCVAEYFRDEHSDVVTHSFTRAPEETLRELLDELTAQGEWHEVSCYIDDGFYMLSLRERNLDWLERRLRNIGALSLYTMRPPMHASVFGPLRRKVEDEVVGALDFTTPKLPVVSDQDGSVVTSAEGMRALLLDGIVKPLRWTDVVATMRDMGVARVYVSGADSLFGRVGITTRNFEVVPVNPRLAMQPRRRVST